MRITIEQTTEGPVLMFKGIPMLRFKSPEKVREFCVEVLEALGEVEEVES